MSTVAATAEVYTPPLVTPDPDANITDLLEQRVAKDPKGALFAVPDGSGGWRDIATAEFRRQVVELAKGFVAVGIQPGEKVGFLAKTTYEWTLVDFALFYAGAVMVPIYETSSASQIQWILSNSEAIACLVESADHQAKLDEIAGDLPLVRATWQIEKGALDTLRRDRFAALTRRDRLDEVLAGVRGAAASALAPLKLNAVAMRGVNDDELVELVEFALSIRAELRFIEQMPLDVSHTWDRTQLVTREEILDALGERWRLVPAGEREHAPAERFLLDGGPASVGVIASVTAPFCAGCDRLRLTADGQLRNCLFSRSEYDLVPVLRGGAVGDIDEVLRACVAGKRRSHGIDEPGFVQPRRGMNAIGG